MILHLVLGTQNLYYYRSDPELEYPTLNWRDLKILFPYEFTNHTTTHYIPIKLAYKTNMVSFKLSMIWAGQPPQTLTTPPRDGHRFIGASGGRGPRSLHQVPVRCAEPRSSESITCSGLWLFLKSCEVEISTLSTNNSITKHEKKDKLVKNIVQAKLILTKAPDPHHVPHQFTNIFKFSTGRNPPLDPQSSSGPEICVFNHKLL